MIELRFWKLLLFLAPGILFGQKQDPLDSIDWQIDLDDIVVTAAYAPTGSRNAIHQIRVIDKVDIQRFQARNLQQLLSLDASVRIQEDRFLGSKTTLLGIGGQNVKIMIDGIPVIGRLDGNIDLSQIHLNNVEQVEIVEGPLSVNYGTDALAGVINIITKKSQLEKYQLSGDIAYEDRGESSASLQLGYRPTQEWYINLQGGLDRFQGWDPDSTRSSLWKPKYQDYANAVVRFLPNGTHDLKYQFNWLNETVWNEGDIRRPQFKPYAFDETFLTRRIDHALHYHGTFNKGWNLWSFVAYNSFYRQVDAWRQDLENGEQLTVTSDQDTSRIQSWNWRTTISNQLPGTRFEFMGGLDLRYDNSAGNRIESTDSVTTFMIDNAVFGSLRYRPTEQIVIESGLRYAYNNRYQTPLIPSLNIKYELNENWTFRGSYGKGFRAPDIKELFFNFIDVNHYIVGNNDLQAETSDNIQLGLTYYRYHEGQEVTFGLKTFYNAIRDKIELFEFMDTPNGALPVTDTVTNTYSYFNIEKFRTAGLSLRFGYDTKIWRVRLGYNLTGQFNPGLSEEFKNENRYAFNNEISVDARYRIPWIDTDLNALIRYYDRLVRFFPAEDENGNPYLGKRVQDGFTNIDLMLGKALMKERVRINLGVRNLLNIQRTGLSSDENGRHTASSTVIQISPGRRFFASASFQLTSS